MDPQPVWFDTQIGSCHGNQATLRPHNGALPAAIPADETLTYVARKLAALLPAN